MTEPDRNRWAVPLEDLEAASRVEQVVEVDTRPAPQPYGDGATPDGDGD